MHSSKSIPQSARLIERCCLTAGKGYCISLISQMMRKTIWVTDEHLNLKGSLSAPSQSDGHPQPNPENTPSHVPILDTVSRLSMEYLYSYAVWIYCTGSLMGLHFPSDHRKKRKDSSSCSAALHNFASWYTILGDWFSDAHFHHSLLFIKCSIISPAPHPRNKSLWCQIDTLVNSTSWIWYCLATAENPLLVASSGRRETGGEVSSAVETMVEEKTVEGINHNGDFCLACLQAVKQN